MSKRLSPLLRSAFEFIEHGLWHFFRSSTSLDLKLALLHVDQAVELILKDKVRTLGHSIYKTPKETISLWDAYKILETKGCKIPEKSDLEILHEERNSIQHKYLNPSAEDTAFHMEKAVLFLKRFLKEELNITLENHVSASYVADLLTPAKK